MIMIATGIFLAMNYTPNTTMAFDSVERIMRDVNYGWLLRYAHVNGASMFFIVVYIHMFRGLYYGSYKAPRELLWMLGVAIFLLMMATAFMGYVLPWGQMSFWGATVITNLFSAIPVVGEPIVHLAVGRLLGRQPDAEPLLQPALPAAVRDLRRGVPARGGAAHHRLEQPARHRVEGRRRTRCRSIRTTRSRTASAICVFSWCSPCWCSSSPNYLGHADNYIPANPLQTPPHIVPEWYFLPFYAILRAVPDKLRRRVADVRLHPGAVRAALARHQPGAQRQVPADLPRVLLGAGGRLHRARRRRRAPAGRHLGAARPVATAYYFFHFLVLLPLLGKLERPLPLPESISQRRCSGGGPLPSGAAAKPMEKA